LVVRGTERGGETNHRVVFVFVCFCFFVQQGDALEASGIRVEVDNRMNKTAGWKMTHWEQKGVPLRLEIGSNEMKTNQLVVCRRFDNQKTTIAMADVVDQCHQMLADVHDCMLDAARQDRDAHLSIVTTWEEFLVEIERGQDRKSVV
jgi:prolyl-tRNA synthetase